MTASCHIPTSIAIDFPDAALDDLYRRLDQTRWPEALAGSGWQQGAALEYVQDLAHFWRTSFDWRTQEAKLNALPHYTTVIDGQRVHFVHVRSADRQALPLLLIHGWPGSFVEFLDVIEPLTQPDTGPAFDLVIASIPGFTLSGPTGEPGWNTERIARAFAELMTLLGYDRFGVQGGDWGAVIAADLGRAAPDRVVGVHVNAATAGFVPASRDGSGHGRATDRTRLKRLEEFRATGSAFFALQATRPQTLAYALTDSPVGLLAWIGEKFHEWSYDPARIDRNRLLTNVTLYWLTGTVNSAARIYYEFARAARDLPRSSVPTGVAVFAEDLAIRSSAEQHNTVVHWSEFDRGGHFAALEEPELLVADVKTFFANGSPA